ncbi:MAG: aldo/keto reductase [Candidatus Dormiibacterota bacterium]
MSALERRPLGISGLLVSELSLGSWRTYERIPREVGIAVMTRARDLGINFLDDARYNDETGHAPMKTGYSEVVFGELFRAVGWKRNDVILANKLWWEFWPDQTAAQELDGSLKRMRMDYIDLAYAERPPDGLGVEQITKEIATLITAGKLRAWGVLNWPASLIAEAAAVAQALGVPGPCAAQLPYSLVMRSPVEDADMVRSLQAAEANVVASYTLVGGALSGKYTLPEGEGRITARIDDRDYSEALDAGRRLKELAREVEAPPAALAIAFALHNTQVATVLFGATKLEQIEENVKAAELARTMDEQMLKRLGEIGATEGEPG